MANSSGGKPICEDDDCFVGFMTLVLDLIHLEHLAIHP